MNFARMEKKGSWPMRGFQAWSAFIILLVALVVSAWLKVSILITMSAGALCLLPLLALSRNLAGSGRDWYGDLLSKWGKVLPPLIFVVLPILGYTEVVRISKCNTDLVSILLGPIMDAGVLAVGLVVVATFLVNTSLLSANASAAVVGAFAIPLLVSSGIRADIAGAAVLTGTWGAVCSFGSAHAGMIAAMSHTDPRRVVIRHSPAALAGLGAVVLVVTLEMMLLRAYGAVAPIPPAFRPSFLRASLPVLPLLVLIVKPLFDRSFVKLNLRVYTTATMILTSGVAIIVSCLSFRSGAVAFVGGVCKGTRDVILLVAVAMVFVEAFERGGQIHWLLSKLKSYRSAVQPFAMLSAMGSSVLTGSSDAPVTAMNTALLGNARSLGIEPTDLGSLIWIGGELGRCLSPAAAVTLTVAELSSNSSATPTSPMLLIELCAFPIVFAAGISFLVIYQRGKTRRLYQVNAVSTTPPTDKDLVTSSHFRNEAAGG